MSWLTALVLVAQSVVAQPPVVDSVTKVIPGMQEKYGVTNFRMVMPGVLYRGGTTGGKDGVPLSADSAQKMCNDGFDAAVYVYSKNWAGGTQEISCARGAKLSYTMKRWDSEQGVKDVMKELHAIITQNQGAMYVHCWFGVHASGYVVTAALKQFCGLSDEAAVAYWNSNVPKSIQYPKVQNMVRAFRADPALAISPEQKARVCPRL